MKSKLFSVIFSLFIATGLSAAPVLLTKSVVVPPPFVVDYGPVVPADVLTLNVSSPQGIATGSASGGVWKGGPTKFTAIIYEHPAGRHQGHFEGILKTPPGGTGAPPRWSGDAYSTKYFIGDGSRVEITSKNNNDISCRGLQGVFTLNPQGAAVNIQWTITGDYVKDYAKGVITPITAKELAADPIGFYWTTAGKKTIKVDYVDSATGKNGTNSVTVTVEEPKAKYKAVAGTASFVLGQGPVLKFNVGPGGKGINFTADVTAPKSFGGEIRYTQTIDNLANAGLVLADKKFTTESTGTQLDNEENYGSIFGSAASATLAAAATDTIAANDSPAILGGEAYKEATSIFYGTKDSPIRFHMYVMFKATGQSIWVPVSLINWNMWMTNDRTSATAAWPEEPKSIGENNYTGKPETALPTWAGTTTSGDQHVKAETPKP